MEHQRTKHTYGVELYEFARDILVVCPACGERAVIHTGNFGEPKAFDVEGVRLICPACGHSKEFGKISRRHPHLTFGAPVDPFFKLPVWLQTDCAGELLWAYNGEHLDFLRQHVAAKLRERNGLKFRVRSIGARLPRWMTSAKNRDEVLKSIDKLAKSA